MKKFIQHYVIFLGFLSLLLIPKIISVISSSNTDGINISENYSVMRCEQDIKIIPTESATSYIKEEIFKKNTTLENDICTLNKSFNGSMQDRVALFAYSITKLEFWTIKRFDIAQYFYKKIIEANPNDAFSLYIKEEKINESNSQ